MNLIFSPLPAGEAEVHRVRANLTNELICSFWRWGGENIFFSLKQLIVSLFQLVGKWWIGLMVLVHMKKTN